MNISRKLTVRMADHPCNALNTIPRFAVIVEILLFIQIVLYYFKNKKRAENNKIRISLRAPWVNYKIYRAERQESN
ncbi:hypothetical protein HZS_781 [Henneguya salminicola]|nr:hypothetical protein HZS_781 [Henneguya salminicola]